MVNRYTFVGLFAVLAVFAVGLLAFALVGGEDRPPQLKAQPTTPAGNPPPAVTATATATARPARNTPLQQASAAAGCTLENPPNEGAEHVPRETTAADYGSNPPTSGVHAPEWAPDRVYRPSETPGLGFLVHTLEHGRINVQYQDGTSDADVAELTTFVNSKDDGYHMLLYQNATGMEYAVAATAWDHLLGCPALNDKVLAALDAFRTAYIDKGPELVP